ncbi:hypothetical protein [Bacillus multifaciens]|uniref:hypothetical protein n=1 Tax=Bacillus multifaciens TaxID=3068506 RepID=UPI00274260D7|nr:hypothetical protein [Bacillus sp. WLY-B-L8]MDP7980245.1 hypothetical protein [Bacillus sp. WLY-B-L8]HDX9589774.1 hypothetical protein [Bacillus pseudomycoides]
MTNKSFLQNVNLLIQMHADGLLGGEIMPEDALIGIVPESELPNVLTLGMSLNYQRNSYTLWQSIAQAYLDDNSRWIFNPHVVAKRDLEELRNVLLHYRVALQPNRHPEIWIRVCKGIIQSSPKGDVSGLIDSVQFDIASLKNTMQIKRKSEFPYLSGPKIFNYWLYVMETYVGIEWKSRELITIAPDTHILKASVKLGLCSSEILNGTNEDRQIVAEAWEKALAGSGLAPIDVHTPLWLWSRAGFPSLSVTKIV